MEKNKFTLYWLDGKSEVITGETAYEAMVHAGYGGGAMSALDFWAYGDNKDYVWNKEKRKWNKI
jgi:hypothetical protein